MITEIYIKGKTPNLNNIIQACKTQGYKGRRGGSYSSLKKKWIKIIANQIENLNFKITKPVVITFYWIRKTRREDPDNISAGGRKVILDTFVELGIVKNDGWIYLHPGFVDRYAVGDTDGVILSIKEIEDERQ